MKVAFAMTINKSQGQTLQNVGVWLSDPCFAHGQLYVAMSRVGSPRDIKFAIRQRDGFPENHTSNVVFKDVLITGFFPSVFIAMFLSHLYFRLIIVRIDSGRRLFLEHNLKVCCKNC